MLLTRPSSTRPRQLRRIQGGSRTKKVDGAMAEVSKHEAKGSKRNVGRIEETKRNENLETMFLGQEEEISILPICQLTLHAPLAHGK